MLGRSLPEPLREEIFLSTKHFGEGGWASKRTLTNTELLKKLDLWRLRTKVLRREISDAEPIKLPEAATRADVVNGFFKWSESAAEQPFGGDQLHVTSQLAFALDAALVACDVIVREISDPRFRNDRGPALWTVWVAIIIQCMAKYEILVEKDRGSKRVVDPPFVEFIEALQKTLPPQEQRRRKFDSLKRGVQHAVVSSGRTSLEVLRSLMNKWGTLGADRLDSHQILPEFDLDHAEKVFLEGCEKERDAVLAKQRAKRKTGIRLGKKSIRDSTRRHTYTLCLFRVRALPGVTERGRQC
jgi:hypothetical protein